MIRLAFADLLVRDGAALVIIKATMVLALASGAAALAKGFSAAQRHLVWLVALSSCVWLMLSSRIVPAVMIHTSMLAQNVVTTDSRTTPARRPSSDAARAPSSRASEYFANSNGVQAASLGVGPLTHHPLIALWILGCIVMFVRHALGIFGATRLTRGASIASDDETIRELTAATAARVQPRVRLGYSANVHSPVTFGVAAPFVLLPTDARLWSSDRRRAVLTHEVAHISRDDWLSQTIGRFACELFWFHPLVWRAFAHLRDEAERAADDYVLRSGMPASEYATHLLELARRTNNARPTPFAVGILSTNHLEQRFVAMLDTKRARAGVTSRARAIAASVALAIVCPLASLHVAAPALRHAAPWVSPFHPTSAPNAATAPNASSAAPPEWNTSRVSQTAGMRTAEAPPATVKQSALEIVTPPIAVVDDSTPSASAIAHPDLSGKWKQDTVAGPMVDFFVTDSTVITQSVNAISFVSRGHVLGAPTYGQFQAVTFDGARSRGITATGHVGANVVAAAGWLGDTLVLTTRFPPGPHDIRTIERMTLSPDGNTLFSENRSFVDGRYRWGGPHTFVLRRIMP